MPHISDDCKQAAKIASIESTLSHVAALLDRHEDREERMMAAMETLAAQAEIIKANAENVSRHEKSIINIYDILRIEKQENLAQKFWGSSAGIYGLGILFMGLAVDCIAHFKIVRSIWAMFNGGSP